MSKPLKIVLGVIGAIVALFVVAAVVLVLTFDPNDYRDDIERIVEDKTGRALKIEGDLALSVFPWLGVELGRTTLGNAEGFGDKPFAGIENVDVAVKLIPLIVERRIEIGTVTLEGMQLNLARNAQGVGNWESLVEKLSSSAEQPEPPPEPEQEAGFDVSTVGIGSVEIKDAALVYDDRQAKKRYAVERINLKTGELRVDEPVNLDLNFVFNSDDPALSAEVDFVGLVRTELAARRYAVDKLTLNVIARGESIPAGEQQVELTGQASYEAEAGHLTVGSSQLQVAGLSLTLDAEGTDMAGDSPQIAGNLSVPTFSPRNLLDKLKIAIPEPRDSAVLKQASLKAKFRSNLKSASLPELKLVLDDTNISGQAAMKSFETQAVEFALKVDSIDADRYLPPPADPASGEAAEETGDLDEIEIPVDPLEQFNANGTVDIGTLKISGMTLKDVSLKLSAPKGKTKTVDLGAKLYEGSVATTTRITPGDKPAYATDTRLSSIAVGDLLKDFSGKDVLSGTGDVALQLNSSGRTVGALRAGLNGSTSLNLVNGAIKGFNIGLAIRKARAALDGEQLKVAEPAQTDFASLIAAGNIVDGVYHSTALDLKNPLFRLTGDGQVDIAAERIDFLAKPTIVATSKGQGGAGLDDLQGLTIPVRIEGPLTSPKLSLDLKDALKDKAEARAKEELEAHEDEIREKIDEKLGGGAADAIKGLFGSRKKKQDEQTQPSGDGGSL